MVFHDLFSAGTRRRAMTRRTLAATAVAAFINTGHRHLETSHLIILHGEPNRQLGRMRCSRLPNTCFRTATSVFEDGRACRIVRYRPAGFSSRSDDKFPGGSLAADAEKGRRTIVNERTDRRRASIHRKNCCRDKKRRGRGKMTSRKKRRANTDERNERLRVAN